MDTTMNLSSFTADELREINDALDEAVTRMLKVQTPQEVEYASLGAAWEAQKKIVAVLLPGTPPNWLVERDPLVRARAPL